MYFGEAGQEELRRAGLAVRSDLMHREIDRPPKDSAIVLKEWAESLYCITLCGIDGEIDSETLLRLLNERPALGRVKWKPEVLSPECRRFPDMLLSFLRHENSHIRRAAVDLILYFMESRVFEAFFALRLPLNHLLGCMRDATQDFVAQLARIVGLILSNDERILQLVLDSVSLGQVLEWIVTSESANCCDSFIRLLANYVRYEIPVPLFQHIVSLLGRVLNRYQGDGSIVSALVYFAFVALSWCGSAQVSVLMNFRDNLSRGHARADIMRDIRIYTIVANVYIQENHWLDMTIQDFIDALREGVEEKVQYYVADHMRRMLKHERADLLSEMNTPYILEQILGLFENLSHRTQHHLIIVLDMCAMGCPNNLLSFYTSKDFMDISICSLVNYNGWLILRFLETWNALFTKLEGDELGTVRERFLTYFREDSIWVFCSGTTREVSDVWQHFVEKWLVDR